MRLPRRPSRRLLPTAVVSMATLTAVSVGPTQAAPLAAATPVARTSKPPVVVIVMENHSYESIMGSSSAGYLRAFAKRGVLFTRYHALHHPSLPNYLEMTSGTTSGCHSDDCPQQRYRTNNVFHQLSHAGISWHAWQESMGTRCRRTSAGRYMTRHNPPLFYRNLAGRQCRLHDTPLPRHLPSRMPGFVFLTPNVCHDMHSCSIAVGNRWLRQHVPPLLRRGARVVITFDEGGYGGGGGGRVYTAAAGPGLPRGVRNGHHFSHRSLLAGIERYFGLPRLHGARRATPLPI